MGPAFGFRMRFSIVGQVERASSNNKAINLQKPRRNQKITNLQTLCLAETSRKQKKHTHTHKPADTMSGRNLEETKKTKNTKLQTLALDLLNMVCAVLFFFLVFLVSSRFLPDIASAGFFFFFFFFGFLEVSATSDNAWLHRTCAFFLPFFCPRWT